MTRFTRSLAVTLPMQRSWLLVRSQNIAALKAMLAEVDVTGQDWQKFTRQGHEFHWLYVDRW
jgi:hypothetical protein